MGTRTIEISEEVDARLWALRKPGESYGGLIAHLLGQPSLTNLVGVIEANQVAIIRRAVEEGRKRSRKRPRRMPPG